MFVQPVLSLTSAGSPHSKSHNRPESGTSIGLGMARICNHSMSYVLLLHEQYNEQVDKKWQIMSLYD